MQHFGQQLKGNALDARHRFCVVLSGDKAWGENSARSICSPFSRDSIIRVSNSCEALEADDTLNTLSLSHAKQALGIETDAVIYDCFSGFDPDAVGILGGTITAGGLMVFFSPELQRWPEFEDPQFARITAYGNQNPEYSHYIKRLIRIISESPDCILVQQGQPLQALPTHTKIRKAETPDFADQKNAVESIKHVVTGQRRRPVVLLSDRGRGKSAALGIAAAELLQGNVQRIGVTGSSRQSVDTVFKHGLPEQYANADSLKYYPADKLIERKPDIDLLLVDEAASIPLPMLARILEIFPRIAFASTVHGYEGTGRGFMLRFKSLLDEYCRGWQLCKLSSPVRWAQGDPLELFLFDLLLLNAESAPIQVAKIDGGEAEVGPLVFTVIEKSELSRNETMTRNVFGLLTQAHYRTRPFDLRHFMDAANLELFGIWQQENLLGVAVIALEGGFDDPTAKKIWANQTRPKGHLLPELLCAQQGLIDAARLNSARVMRIVVHPEFQRRGIGKFMLNHISDYYTDKVDFVGTTFGASLSVVEFWRNCDFSTMRIGFRKSHNTGTHAIAMIKPVSQRGKNLAIQAGTQFSENLSSQLISVLSDIDPELVAVIYNAAAVPKHVELHPGDFINLAGFAFAGQNMLNIPISLVRLAEIALQSNSTGLDGQDKILLVERIMLGKSWKNCSALPEPKGKKQGVAELRRIIGAILVALYPQQIKPIMAEFDLKPN